MVVARDVYPPPFSLKILAREYHHHTISNKIINLFITVVESYRVAIVNTNDLLGNKFQYRRQI
jgi:hypothetical protein